MDFRKTVYKFWHKVEHKFGWNAGNVVSKYKDGKHKVGFRCCGCKKIEGMEDIPNKILYPEINEKENSDGIT